MALAAVQARYDARRRDCLQDELRAEGILLRQEVVGVAVSWRQRVSWDWRCEVEGLASGARGGSPAVCRSKYLV